MPERSRTKLSGSEGAGSGEPAAESILTVQVSQEMDFLLARQRAKQIAALLGFDLQEQTRVATAVSEIARNAYEYASGGRVEFRLADKELQIVVSDHGPGIAALDAIFGGTYTSRTGMGLGIIGARRLMDSLEVETGKAGTAVTLRKRLPRSAKTPPTIAQIGRELAANPARQSLAIHEQDAELLRLLGEIRARESELRVVNQELEETNRGVLVLYAELEDKARAVQQASEMKTRFLSGVTHELRTPLNSIVSLSRLMLSHTDGPLNPEQEKQVQFILRSAQNLTEMVSDLLDVARVEAGKATVTLSEFTAADLLAGLRGMFRPLATNPDVRLIFAMPDEVLRLETDEGKLAQILRNFISNALKFTERGSVTVSVEPAGRPPADGRGWVTFRVADTGVGIAAEHMGLVMEEWGQVPDPGLWAGGGPRQKGSGLGLPLSRSFAELLGGQVAFTSVEGQGSTFQVTLPALLQNTPAADLTALTSEARDAGQVLLVDDDEVSRYLLRRRLRAHTAAEIVEAVDGQEALEAIRLRRPNLLFLDLMMPGLGGLEIVRQLRDDARTADLPIVVHTAKTLTDEDREALTRYDLIWIPKRGEGEPDGGADGREEQTAQIERALLGVGLANLNQEPAGETGQRTAEADLEQDSADRRLA